MRICLVLMPNWQRSTPSVALAYLKSNLIGHKVTTLDFNLKIKNTEWSNYFYKINVKKRPINISRRPKLNYYLESCLKEILRHSPEIVGFSVYSYNMQLSLMLAQKLKKRGLTIIFGGSEIMFNRKNIRRCLQYDYVDYVISGEAELVLKQFLDDFRKKPPKGVSYKHKENIILSDWEPIKDLDSLKFPLYNKEDIHDSEKSWIPYSESKMLPLVASRGCNYSCAFCSVKNNWKGFRQRTVKNVIEEIRFDLKKYKIKEFKFDDSLINQNINWLKELCKMLIDEKLNILWGGHIRVDKKMDKKMFHLMYHAGCRYLHFGIESGSDRVLRLMNKGITKKTAAMNLKFASDANILTHTFFIVDFPKESEKDFFETVQFIADNKNHIQSFCVNTYFQDPYANKILKRINVTNKQEIMKRIFTCEHNNRFFLRTMLEDDNSEMSCFYDYKINEEYLRSILLKNNNNNL